MSDQPHWEQHLVRYFVGGRTTPVTIEVDPDRDHGSMILLASRLTGVFEALKQRGDEGHDPLVEEDEQDLLRLADHLHRVISTLTGQEDRLIDVLRRRGVSSHRIAAAMEVDHKTVLNRYRRIDRAHEQGLNSMAYSETKAAELSD